MLGWTSPVKAMVHQYYDFPVSEEAFSWIGAFMAVGAIFGSAATGAMVDMFGRKKTILMLTVPMTLAWLLILWGPSVSNTVLNTFTADLLMRYVIPVLNNDCIRKTRKFDKFHTG